MITAIEIDFFKAQEQFESICEFVQRASEQGARIDQVERGLFPQAMEMWHRGKMPLGLLWE